MIFKLDRYLKIIGLWVVLIVLTLQDDLIYNYQHTFYTNLRLTSAIAVSPYENRFVVGAEDGQVKIYNYDDLNSGPFYLIGHLSKIVQIVWGQNRYGIISISTENTSSLAIQWNVTLSQTYRWNFQNPTYGASLTQNTYQGYIAFNHRTIVNSYNIRTKQIASTVTSGDTEGISDAKFSNGYRYLYVTQGSKVFTFTCGTAYSFFIQYSQNFQQISPDFSNQVGNQIILKQASGDFSVFSKQKGMIIKSIPIQNILQFKYCEADYIIGLTTSKKLFLADKNTYQIKQVIEFNKASNLNVVSFICDKKVILVGYSNGQVDLYKFAEFDALKLIIIVCGCFIFLLIIVAVIWRIIVSKRRNNQNYQSQQPLVKQNNVIPQSEEPSWRRKKQKQATTITKPSAFDSSNWQKKQEVYRPPPSKLPTYDSGWGKRQEGYKPSSSKLPAYDGGWGKREEGYKPSSKDNNYWRKQEGYKGITYEAGSWSKKKYQDYQDSYDSGWK